MRLLDHIAQSTTPLVVRQDSGATWRLTGAAEFSAALTRCPLRYVLTDELVRVCVELAYSEGDDLSGCLDLLHLPAEQLWVEWSEPVRHEALARVLPECVSTQTVEAERSGVLVCADPGGRSGSLRTFWLSRSGPLVAAVETALDLEGGGVAAPPEALLNGDAVSVSDPQNEQLNDLLRCARFRLDPAWQRYYRGTVHDPARRPDIIRRLVASVAFDIPMLLALFLLLAIRADLLHREINPARLNKKRARLKRRPLLEHVEVSAPLFIQAAYRDDRGHSSVAFRNGPRFHHVRGHIVRRRNAVYWRGPHWRGHLRLGQVRSRTVELRLRG